MAEAITAYRCEHGCGHVRTKRAAVVAHEARCFKNPVTRSCQTCDLRAHPEMPEYDFGTGRMLSPGYGWDCKHSDGPIDGKPRSGCEFWEAGETAERGGGEWVTSC